MKRRNYVLCLVCTLAISSAARAATLRTVALSGQQAPGMPDGVNFNSLFTPVLNDAGQTAFVARLTGSGVDSTNNNGIWSEGSGSLTLVARQGSHAPGTPSGVNYGHAFLLPVLNDAGQIAFKAANLTGAGVNATNNGGIWSEASGSMALVARSGDRAPGTPSGVNFSTLDDRLVLNNAGQTAFRAFLSGSGVNGFNLSGIWSEGSGSLGLVVRGGSQAPGMPSGVNFDFSGNAVRPVLNIAGQTAFWAPLTSGGGDGIWSDRSGNLAPIARTGDQAPGMPSGVNFSGFTTGTNPALNDAGQTAFLAGLSAGGAGIWSEGSGSLALVARIGDHAPGTPNGVNYYGVYDPVLNNVGQTAFLAVLTSIGVNGGLDTGLWSEGSGSLALVARSGDHAPGTLDGVNFSNLNYCLNDGSKTLAFRRSL